MAGRRLQLRVSLCCVIVVREARGSREIFVEQTWDAQNLALSSSGAICAETTPTPCHSGATSISAGICLLPAEKQPILRATLPRFGMTILLGNLKITPLHIFGAARHTPSVCGRAWSYRSPTFVRPEACRRLSRANRAQDSQLLQLRHGQYLGF